MLQNLLTVMLLALIAAFTFDVSFNLRRTIQRLDTLWRKLVEIDETLKKKY
jgi:hypothetical protein